MASIPVGLEAVVPVNLGSPSGVCHVWPLVLVKSRRLFQKLLLGIQDQSFLDRVDSKGLPGNGKQFVTHTQKTAERQYGEGDLPSIQVDHDLLDLAQVFALVVHHVVTLQTARGEHKPKSLCWLYCCGHERSPLCFEAELGVVAYRRRLTERGLYRLASSPSGVLHDISSAMYCLFRVDKASDQNGTALRPDN